MSLEITLALSVAFLGFAVLAGWLGARPPNPMKGPRLVPWRFLMLMSTAGLVLMIVHLVSFTGVTTGR